MSTGALTQTVAIGAQETNFLSNDKSKTVFSKKKILKLIILLNQQVVCNL